MKFVHTNIAAKDWKSLSQFYITVFDCRVKPPERKYEGEKGAKDNTKKQEDTDVQ